MKMTTLDQMESSIQISGTVSTIATVGIIILLVGLYALFAPAKIRKIE